MAANCALAAAQPQVALDRAQAAYRLFRSQQSAWWQAHAGLVLVQARYAAGPVSAQLLRAANRAADPAGGARLGRGHPGASAGRAGGTGPGPPRRRRSSSHRGRPQPAARPGAVTGQRLARRGTAGRGGRATRAACSPPAAAGWRSWMSSGSPWAPRNCEPRPPPTGPSWLSSRSGMPRGLTGRGSCWPGVNAGGPPRWRSRRSGPRPTQDSPTAWPRCARSPAGWRTPGARAVPSAALQRQQQRLERSVRATSLRARGAPDPGHSRGQHPANCSTSSAPPS